MLYSISYSKQAIKALRNLPENLRDRICHKINMLAMNPFAVRHVKILRGTDGYQLRIGEWRVIYEINRDRLEIYIIKVAPRSGAYKL